MVNRLIIAAFLLQPLLANATDYNLFTEKSIAGGHIPPGIISKFYGELQHGAATIFWKLYEEGSSSLFYIERSDNGKDFTELAQVNSSDGINFQYKDSLPLPTGFYRIKATGRDTVYSDIIRMSTLSGLPQVKVWPALFDVVINVEVNTAINETFTAVLTNSKGETLISKELAASKGNSKMVLDDTVSFLYPDEYTLTVTGLQYSYSQKLYKK
jgi:hypothetical protein